MKTPITALPGTLPMLPANVEAPGRNPGNLDPGGFNGSLARPAPGARPDISHVLLPKVARMDEVSPTERNQSAEVANAALTLLAGIKNFTG